MVTIHDVAQGSDEWLALRSGKYTGSNAWKLLKYGTVSYALAGESGTGKTYWTERGHILEPECIEIYEAIAHDHVQRPGFVTNDLYPMAGYSPDGLTESWLIEVKCFNQKKHLSIYHGDIPFAVLAQIHFGMLITELKQARLLIYNPELEPKLAFKMIEIRYNRNIANNFKRILKEVSNEISA